MENEAISSSPEVGGQPASKRQRPLKAAWKAIRKPLAQSRIVKAAIVGLFTAYLRFAKWTNPPADGSPDEDELAAGLMPGVLALWHGQHILALAIKPTGFTMAAMFSKSNDAELNAKVAEQLGYHVVRGSGGRDGLHDPGKGGARALLMLKKLLDRDMLVCMIADIPHGTPREAGLGVVTLARVSGRPVFPLAIATSRRSVIEKSWDKTTINLPFGRRAVVLGDPIFVDKDAGPDELEAKRGEVTAALNAATEKAYALVDGAPQ